jgi:hypothetical protein
LLGQSRFPNEWLEPLSIVLYHLCSVLTEYRAFYHCADITNTIDQHPVLV